MRLFIAWASNRKHGTDLMYSPEPVLRDFPISGTIDQYLPNIISQLFTEKWFKINIDWMVLYNAASGSQWLLYVSHWACVNVTSKTWIGCHWTLIWFNLHQSRGLLSNQSTWNVQCICFWLRLSKGLWVTSWKSFHVIHCQFQKWCKVYCWHCTLVSDHMATSASFRYTNSKLDTVEAGIEVVKAKVGIVDEKVGAMAEDWKNYGSKIHELEDNIHFHDSKMEEFRSREEIHSAKLRNLENELSKLRAQNTRLQDEVLMIQRSPRFVEEGRDRGRYQSPNTLHDTDKRNVDFQRDHLTHRDTYREQMHGPEPPSKSYNSREGMLERERQLEAQIRREMQKIELHDGNFKPWARDAKNPTHHVVRLHRTH